MKLCPACRKSLAGVVWSCPRCGWMAPCELGVTLLTPRTTQAPGGFKPEQFTHLFRLESENFWFRSRNRFILWAINRYFPSTRDMMELGCGTGFVSSAVERERPDIKLTATELYADGAVLAARRLKNATVLQIDARDIPFESEFDLVGAFDVIEHIGEDKQVLCEIHRSLKSGGGLLLTVPQHPALWSRVDDFSHHKRRYTRPELMSKVEESGFRVLRCTSFVTLLLPVMIASRLLARDRIEFDPFAEFEIPVLFNWFFERTLDVERWLISAGFSLPVGGSLLLVAKRS